MLLTNHVLSGALIGSVARRPGPAFVAGVASHFALDAVPHWGPFRERRALLRVAVPDGLTALAVLTAFTAAAPPPRRLALMAGMLGAALPDLDKPSQLLFGRSPFPRAVGRFHSRIQDESMDRFPVEAATATILALAGVLAQVADRRSSGPVNHHGVSSGHLPGMTGISRLDGRPGAQLTVAFPRLLGS